MMEESIAVVFEEILLFHSIKRKLLNALLLVFESFVYMRSHSDQLVHVSEKVMYLGRGLHK